MTHIQILHFQLFELYYFILIDLILESIKQKIQEVESLMSKEDVLEKLNDVKLNLKEIAEKFQAFTTNRSISLH